MRGEERERGGQAAKWILVGCGGCIAGVILVIALMFGGCLGSGYLLNREIEAAATRELGVAARAFLSAMEAGDYAAAQARLTDDLRGKLPVEQLAALRDQEPAAYQVADVVFERVTLKGPLAGMMPVTLRGEIRTRSGGTAYCRFVLERVEVEPAVEPRSMQTGAAPGGETAPVDSRAPAEPLPTSSPEAAELQRVLEELERVKFEWRIQQFEVSSHPLR